MVRTIDQDDIGSPHLMTQGARQSTAGSPALLLAHGAAEGEFVLDAVGRNGAGIKLRCVVEAEPFEHLWMLFVVGVGEDLL